MPKRLVKMDNRLPSTSKKVIYPLSLSVGMYIWNGRFLWVKTKHLNKLLLPFAQVRSPVKYVTSLVIYNNRASIISKRLFVYNTIFCSLYVPMHVFKIVEPLYIYILSYSYTGILHLFYKTESKFEVVVWKK